MPAGNRHREEPKASKEKNDAFDLNSLGLSVFPRFRFKGHDDGVWPCSCRRCKARDRVAFDRRQANGWGR